MQTTEQLFKKALTAKKLRESVIIGHHIVVRNSKGELNVFSAASTSTVEVVVDFNEAPFIVFYDKFCAANEAKIEAVKEAETMKIKEAKDAFIKCETPSDLSVFFGSVIETAEHWSDLYEGRSKYAISINSREEYELFELAKEVLNIDGYYVILCNKGGEHHSTCDRIFDLDDFQKNIRDYEFGGDKYFFKSQETEAESILEQVKEATDLDEVAGLMKLYDELQTGYYDCNGNLEMLESDLMDPDFTGYSSDVYSYRFGFRFAFKNEFNEVEEEEEED